MEITEGFFEIPELLPPSDDGVFKSLLTHPDGGSVLRDVVVSVTGLPIVRAEVKNTEIPISDAREKRERFDVNCTLDDNAQADVEMQAEAMDDDKLDNEHRILKGRAIYNVSDLHSSQAGIGVRYDKLMKSYQVMFCGFTIFPYRDGFVHRFSFRDETGEQLADSIGIVFIELTKLGEVLKKPVEQMTSLEMWSIFFAHADNPKYRNVLHKISAAKEEIKVAEQLLSNISKDDIERAHFRSRRMYRMDWDTSMGMAEDRAKREMAKEMAKSLLSDGFPAEAIAKASGLSREEIEQLRQ